MATGSTRRRETNRELAHVENPPDPSALVESLRAFGYGFVAAVCDIIDNSLGAGADSVRVDFDWDGRDSTVVVADNGSGMDAAELIRAMRLGAKSPVEIRAASDLGRFGLGLKTASFSQGRRLVVSSRRLGQPVAHAVWDLDEIARSSAWRMGLQPDPEERRRAETLLGECGTVVQWSTLDRFVGAVAATDEGARDGALRQFDELEDELAAVYSDWLQGVGRVRMEVNGNPVQAWDPFLTHHRSTQAFPTEWLPAGGGRAIPVAAFVLPHHQRLSREEHRAAGGRGGWNAQQGFYVYRNRRLLVMGGWLGLGIKAEEHCKLARIRVDLENVDDHAWQIDVRKQQAVVPEALRSDLQRIARATRSRASEVYRSRGRVLRTTRSRDDTFVWQQRSHGGRKRFELNRRHPMVRELTTRASPGLVTSFLRLVETTVPIVDIAMAHNEQNDEFVDPWAHVSSADLLGVAKELLTVIEPSLGRDEALRRLAVMEPCSSRPELLGLMTEKLAGD